jgi:putative transposase
MVLVCKEQIRKFVNGGNLKVLNDVQPMLKELFASTVQEMLEEEIDTHFGYAKNTIRKTKIPRTFEMVTPSRKS